jgi:hypothetical protein
METGIARHPVSRRFRSGLVGSRKARGVSAHPQEARGVSRRDARLFAAGVYNAGLPRLSPRPFRPLGAQPWSQPPVSF